MLRVKLYVPMYSLRIPYRHFKFTPVAHNDNLLGFVADNVRWTLLNLQATADLLDEMDIANHNIQVSSCILRYRAKEGESGI